MFKANKWSLYFFILIIIVLVSGCVQLEMHQKINRDASSDIELTMDFANFVERAENELETEGEVIQLKKDLLGFCDNFDDSRGFDTCSTTDDYKVFVSGKISSEDNTRLEVEKELFFTTYRYNIQNTRDIIPLRRSPSEEELRQAEEEGNFKLTYTLEMPGEITQAEVGEVQGNTVVVNLFDLLDEDSYLVESRAVSLIWFVIGGFVIIGAGGFGAFLIRKKKQAGGTPETTPQEQKVQPQGTIEQQPQQQIQPSPEEICPECNAPAAFISQYQRYYCNQCKQYLDIIPTSAPPEKSLQGVEESQTIPGQEMTGVKHSQQYYQSVEGQPVEKPTAQTQPAKEGKPYKKILVISGVIIAIILISVFLYIFLRETTTLTGNDDFETDSNNDGIPNGWVFLSNEPEVRYSEARGCNFAFINTPPYRTGITTTSDPSSPIAEIEKSTLGREVVAFSGLNSIEIHASIDCARGSIGQFRIRSQVETLNPVNIPEKATKLGFWTRMASNTQGTEPPHPRVFAYDCRSVNYDTRNRIIVSFDNTTVLNKETVVAETSGTTVRKCEAHVTESLTDENYAAFFKTYNKTETGVDGQKWYYYVVDIPEEYRNTKTKIGIGVDHFQNWASKGTTGVYIDDIQFVID